MKQYNVYGVPNSGVLFSKGITRVFGENKVISCGDNSWLASVMPLKCDPKEVGFDLVGTIGVEE